MSRVKNDVSFFTKNIQIKTPGFYNDSFYKLSKII